MVHDVIILVQIPSATAWRFLVYKLFHELVSIFGTKFCMAIILGHDDGFIRFGDLDLISKVTAEQN